MAPLAEDQRASKRCSPNRQCRASLAVDVNGRFDLPTAIAYGKTLRHIRSFGTRKPGIRSTTRYRPRSPSTILIPWPPARISSVIRMRNLLRYGGMRSERDWLQFDCALSYGLCEYQRTLAVLTEMGWSWSRCIPHGGHQMSLNIAAGLGLGGNEDYPGLFQPFGGFPDGVRVEDGYITLPELTGLGFEGKSKLIKVMRDLAE